MGTNAHDSMRDEPARVSPVGLDDKQAAARSDAADPLAGFQIETGSEPAAERSVKKPRVSVFRRLAGTAETSPSSPAPVPRPLPSTGPPIGLDQVLDRSTKLLWVEGVAILEALCALLADNAAASVPEELSNVLITAEGTVQIRGRARQTPPGPRLARHLLTLTASDTAPVPLRLFITKWASFAEAHTIQDYAQELAYFARPDGAGLIRDVYGRFLTTPAVQPTFESEKPAARPPDQQPPRQSRHRTHIAIVAVVASLAAVALAAIWFWNSDQMTAMRTILGRLQSERVTASEPEQGVPLSDVAAASSSSPSIVQRAPGTTQPNAASQVERSLSQLDNSRSFVSPEVRSLLLSVGARGTVQTPVGTDTVTTLPMWAEVPMASAVNASDPRDATVTARIYSSDDPGVQPPEMVAPSLPPALFRSGGDLNTMELIISDRGTVERVRLVSSPRRMTDMMLLSGAKMWKFAPASIDGQSVRYRLLMSWAATP